MAEVGVITPRRYYLLKAQAAADIEEFGLESAWKAKQLEVESLDLPATFPHRTLLVAAGYSAKDDIIGADTDELRLRVAGLSKSGAVVVIAQAPLIV